MDNLAKILAALAKAQEILNGLTPLAAQLIQSARERNELSTEDLVNKTGLKIEEVDDLIAKIRNEVQ